MDIKEYLENTHISEWDVSNVKIMGSMFFNNMYFNQDISNWDVSSVIDMKSMFRFATSFNQDLSSWGDKLHPDVMVYNMFKDSGLEGNEPKWYLDKIKGD